MTRRDGAILLALAMLPGCARAPAPVTFVNRVWAVADPSSVPKGALYVFVSDGTLLITAPTGTPAVGAWKRDASGLTVIEEGRPYPADILRLDSGAFWLRLHNPGTPTLLRFAPADTSAPGPTR